MKGNGADSTEASMKATLDTYIHTAGFEQVAAFDAAGLKPRQDVRDMCAADRCHSYARNWMCPPHCGELTTFKELLDSYSAGILFQTVGMMEDSLDYEAIEAAAKLHGSRLHELAEKVRELGTFAEQEADAKLGTFAEQKGLNAAEGVDAQRGADGQEARPGQTVLLLGAGACTICPQCACPGEPCRHPSLAFPSMEAAGLLVSEVCELAGIPYYHGPNTIAFCSCVVY